MANELRNFTLTSIKNIQKAIENNKLVIFVGAGVSRNSGIPMWNELIKELANDLGIKAKGKDVDGNEFFSNDECLKIPQYYYNERKEKEYTDKVKEVLDKDFQPNEIHKIIFELNPMHIVTTNYDNLIEQQSAQTSTKKKYCKVANDEELATAPICNFILKMHGEFNNIVLKESDYDSYSNNFKLIETYVKGLFATHTILFIGFSAEDSNIRKILQWIKDIIGDKHQPAYLIDIAKHDGVSEEEFRIKFEYYKNQGIFTLYKSQINDDITTVYNNCKDEITLIGPGLDLYEMLFFIKNFEDISTNSENIIDKYYYLLKQLECLNIITNDILTKVFNAQIPTRLKYGGQTFPLESKQQTLEIDTLKIKKILINPDDLKENLIYLRYNSLLSENEEAIINQINIEGNKEFSEEQQKILKETISELQKKYFLSKDEIEKVTYIFNIIKKAQEAEHKILVEDNILHYSFDIIPPFVNKNTTDIFKKAFYLYNGQKYTEAFYELERISKDYNDNPIIYYIAEFNKKTLTGHLKWNSRFTERTDEEKRIENEYEKIDLEYIINNKIPQSLKPVIEVLTTKNIQKMDLSIVNLSEKIADYKRTIENGGSGFNQLVPELYQKLYAFYNFMMSNYLFIEDYKETTDLYYHSIKAILTSYSTTGPKESSFNFFGVHKVPNFDYFDFYIIIENLKNKEFKSLIDIYKIEEIELKDKNVISELLNAFGNLLHRTTQCNDIRISDKISNFLTIFSLIDINLDEIKIIIDTYTKFVNVYISKAKTIDSYNFRGIMHNTLAAFIASISNKYIQQNKKLPANLYEDIIDLYKEVWTPFVDDYLRLMKNCIYALLNRKGYKLKKQELIDFYINNADKIECTDKILVNLYSLADKIHKNEIKEFFNQQKYSEITLANCDIMLDAIAANIINETKTMEAKLLTLIHSKIQEKLNTSSSSESSREPIVSLTFTILNLTLKNKWKSLKELPNLITELKQVARKFNINKAELNEAIKLLEISVDPDNFDYKRANITDFKYLSDATITKIKTNNNVKNSVIKLLIEKFDFNQSSEQGNKRLKAIFEGFID